MWLGWRSSRLLDRVVSTLYTGSGVDVSSFPLPPARSTRSPTNAPPTSTPPPAQQQTAQQALTQFQEHPDAWQRVPGILQASSNLNTKVSRARARRRCGLSGG